MSRIPARVARAARRMRLRTLLAGLASAALVACEGPPETVVGSDVPQIVGLENRHASGIDHDGETLVAGRFLYRGKMRDPTDVAEDTAARYRRHGWTLLSEQIHPTSALLLFTKDDREVRIDLKCNLLNPSMGAGSIDVFRRGAAPAAGTAGTDDAS